MSITQNNAKLDARKVSDDGGFVSLSDIHFGLDEVSFQVKEPETGESWYLNLRYDVCAAFLELIKNHGMDLAVNIAISSTAMAHRGFGNIPDHGMREIRGITAALDALETHRPLFTTLDKHMMRYSYMMLYEQMWTRERAADVAGIILGRPITAEAWRKAVNKWARENQQPKLDLPHGRPSKKNRNDQ